MIRSFSLVLTLTCISAASVRADFIDVNLSGNTSYDGWDTFNSTAYPNYGGYPGTTVWPAPIGSSMAGSGDAALSKIGGSGYPSTSTGQNYIYSTRSGAAAASTDPSVVVGTFGLGDASPVADLETVVFQLRISYWTSLGQPFPTGVMPTISYNNGTQALPATLSTLVDSGPFSSTYGDGIADDWAFQWDLSGIQEPITSFQVNYSVTNHAQQYEMRLDQSDAFAAVVPEPGSIGLVAMATFALAVCRRRAGAR